RARAGGRARTLLAAEDLASDRGEQPLRLRLLGDLLLGENPAALVLFRPGCLERIRRIARREQHFLRLRIAGKPLDGHVQEALLVEDEVHLLSGGRRREAQRAQVFVVDDALAVSLEDVQLEAPWPGRREP